MLAVREKWRRPPSSNSWKMMEDVILCEHRSIDFWEDTKQVSLSSRLSMRSNASSCLSHEGWQELRIGSALILDTTAWNRYVFLPLGVFQIEYRIIEPFIPAWSRNLLFVTSALQGGLHVCHKWNNARWSKSCCPWSMWNWPGACTAAKEHINRTMLKHHKESQIASINVAQISKPLQLHQSRDVLNWNEWCHSTDTQ